MIIKTSVRLLRELKRGRYEDFNYSGAWLLLVGGLSCQVNSGNERDLERNSDM